METTGHAAGRAYGILLLAALAAVLAGGCASSGGGAEDGGRADIEASTLGALGIPLSAVPRPGKCRIWRPGNPSTRQLGPGSCSRLERRVEAGGWLLRRPEPPEGGPDRVLLVVYGEDGPSMVRVFDRETGKMVRERVPE